MAPNVDGLLVRAELFAGDRRDFESAGAGDLEANAAIAAVAALGRPDLCDSAGNGGGLPAGGIGAARVAGAELPVLARFSGIIRFIGGFVFADHHCSVDV